MRIAGPGGSCTVRQAAVDEEFVGCRRYLNALQATAQHLLRYLAAAVVVNKRRRNAMKDLIRVIEQESYEYSDPITQFLECLFVRYDFEGAQVRQPLPGCRMGPNSGTVISYSSLCWWKVLAFMLVSPKSTFTCHMSHHTRCRRDSRVLVVVGCALILGCW